MIMDLFYIGWVSQSNPVYDIMQSIKKYIKGKIEQKVTKFTYLLLILVKKLRKTGLKPAFTGQRNNPRSLP